jgi:tetratricopeptide (TPR) repeat protein
LSSYTNSSSTSSSSSSTSSTLNYNNQNNAQSASSLITNPLQNTTNLGTNGLGSSTTTTNTTTTSTNATNSTSTSNVSGKVKLYEEIIREYGTEYASYVLQILATVYSKTDRISQAVEFYKKSLRQNPFMWSSFEHICNMGEKIDSGKYFTYNSALNAYKNQILDAHTLQIYQQQHENQLQQQELQMKTQKLQQQQQQLLQQQQQFQQQQQQTQTNFNVLKQIDQENDMLLMDHKCKQDIAHILRLVESDHLTKLNPKKMSINNQNNYCQLHQDPKKFKENQNSNNEMLIDSSSSTTTTSTALSAQQTTCCQCCCHSVSGLTNNSNDNSIIIGETNKLNISNSNKQTPLLNQV